MNIKESIKIIDRNSNKDMSEKELEMIAKLLERIRKEDLEQVCYDIISRKWLNFASINDVVRSYIVDQEQKIADSAIKYLGILESKLHSCFNTQDISDKDVKATKFSHFYTDKEKQVKLFNKKDLQVINIAYKKFKTENEECFECLYNLTYLCGFDSLRHSLQQAIEYKIKIKNYPNLISQINTNNKILKMVGA